MAGVVQDSCVEGSPAEEVCGNDVDENCDGTAEACSTPPSIEDDDEHDDEHDDEYDDERDNNRYKKSRRWSNSRSYDHD